MTKRQRRSKAKVKRARHKRERVEAVTVRGDDKMLDVSFNRVVDPGTIKENLYDEVARVILAARRHTRRLILALDALPAPLREAALRGAPATASKRGNFACSLYDVLDAYGNVLKRRVGKSKLLAAPYGKRKIMHAPRMEGETISPAERRRQWGEAFKA
jgi:hypothetical protein